MSQLGNGFTREGQMDTLPSLPSFLSPQPRPISRIISEFDLDQKHACSPCAVGPYVPQAHPHLSDPGIEQDFSRASTPATDPVPPSLLSPAFTPPTTPGISTPAQQREPKCTPVDSANGIDGGAGTRKPKLLEKLPEVSCVVAARIPMYVLTKMMLRSDG